ncbi:DddA-like double-stranded DNA deaminase toxin [Micromonospora sonneratiae]
MLDQLARTGKRAAASAAALAALQRHLLALTRGSHHPRVAEALARLQASIQRLQESAELSSKAGDAIGAYLEALGPGSTPTHQPTPDDGSRTEALIDQVRASLPRGVHGSQTRGKWITSNGTTEDLRSGEGDEWHRRAKEFAAGFPARLRAASRLAVHVEVKFAMRMRSEGRLQETIVIDRTVCGQRPTDKNAPFTCDKFLKWFLPAGAKLTVVEPDGTRRVYQGKSKE